MPLPAALAPPPADEAHVFRDDRLPTLEQQLFFCRAYLQAIQQQHQQAGRHPPAERPPAAADEVKDKGASDAGTAAAKGAAGRGGGGTDAGAALAAAILGAVPPPPPQQHGTAGAGSGGGDDGSEGAVPEALVQLLLRKVQAHTPLVHLQWGLWGLVQDKVSHVEFLHRPYGEDRVRRYHSTKQALLAPAE